MVGAPQCVLLCPVLDPVARQEAEPLSSIAMKQAAYFGPMARMREIQAECHMIAPPSTLVVVGTDDARAPPATVSAPARLKLDRVHAVDKGTHAMCTAPTSDACTVIKAYIAAE